MPRLTTRWSEPAGDPLAIVVPRSSPAAQCPIVRLHRSGEKMTKFRKVRLPEGVRGVLLLHSMPGRGEPLGDTWQGLAAERVTGIVSLASADEARAKSPAYAKAIVDGEVPCARDEFPIADYG